MMDGKYIEDETNIDVFRKSLLFIVTPSLYYKYQYGKKMSMVIFKYFLMFLFFILKKSEIGEP